MDAKQALINLWHDIGLPADALHGIALTGADPALPSSFHVGQMAQVSIGAAALAAAELHRRRGGKAQNITVDARNAAIEFRSERYLRVDGGEAPELWDKIAGAYRCGDGNWVRIHTNFPHHRDGVLKLLQCAHDREAVARALESWTAEKFEDAAAAAGMVVAKARTFAEWDAHPQGQAVRTLPLITLEKIGDAPKLSMKAGTRPLENLRVLEMTRVLAGPVCGRTLAAHGADVLRVISPNLPTIDVADIDTGRGKRSAHVDLVTDHGQRDFHALLEGADVFVQSYRPGAVAGRSFGPQDAAAIRPGIVCVSLSAYGHAGPWATRRGFDSLTHLFATAVYRAQEMRYRRSGVLTGVSEGHLSVEPYFAYASVWGGGQDWAVLTFSGDRIDSRRTLSTKAAFGWDALFATEYTSELMKAIRPIADPARGWPEGIYEQDGAVNGSMTANTNATVLSAEASALLSAPPRPGSSSSR